MNQNVCESESSAQAHSISTKNYKDRLQRSSLGFLIAVIVTVSGCSNNADLPRNKQTVGGMTIELGVMPAERVTGHATAPGEPNAMHGGTPPNGSSNHIVVALFDAKTGARITDAQIRAGVGKRWYNHEPDRAMEAMEISGTKSYGNFFSMQDAGIWRIHLVIRRPGVARPVEADFGYEKVSL